MKMDKIRFWLPGLKLHIFLVTNTMEIDFETNLCCGLQTKVQEDGILLPEFADADEGE